MRTYLLVWNEKRWTWDEFDSVYADVRSGLEVRDRWSCGTTKRIRPADRVFLMRLGVEPKGIIGSGFVVSDVFVGPHWDKEKAGPDQTSLHIEFVFDELADRSDWPVIAREELLSPPFDGMHWDAQASGTEIPSEIAAQLEEHWKGLRRDVGESPAKDFLVTYREGKRTTIQVSRYERSAAARAACVSVFGTSCQVCQFDFEIQFGHQGRGIIHVHHRRELSSTGEEHSVDPATDLIPVCPNCHAMLHSKSPAYSIEELRELLATSR